MPMMFLLYIDESGIPDLRGNTAHFVLSGLAIPALEWKEFDSRIHLIKKKYALESHELHAGWMSRQYPEQDFISDFAALDKLERVSQVKKKRKERIKLAAATKSVKQLKEINKNFKMTDSYLHLTHDERLNCLAELADLIGNWSNARLFAEAVDKRCLDPNDDGVFERSFEQVVSRFEAFLNNRSRAKNENLYGLIIQDQNQAMCLRLTELMRKFHRQGTLWRMVNRIVETPLFVDSHLTSMVQMADISAYAIRRFFDNNEEELFNRIYPSFDRAGNSLVGIRHYTGQRSCSCQVCKDHKQ